MRRWIILFCLMLMVVASGVCLAAIEPHIVGDQTGIVMDADSGEVYWQKNSNQHRYPASITKVLTALVVLENSKLTDMVQISDNAIDSIIGSTLWLEYGESQSVENLLHGLMMVSANDAAVALAEHVSGSVELFAEKMNLKARELGALDSHFSNPHGLHEENHYSTAHDMALIFSAALNNSDFLRITNCAKYSMPWHGKTEERVIYHATLQALPYPWVLANKNGYTDEAGQTLAYGAQKQSIRFVAILMNSNDIWNEMDRLLLSTWQELQTDVLFPSGSVVSFGSQPWVTTDETKIVQTEKGAGFGNYVLSLNQEKKQIELVRQGTILASSKILSEEFKELPWYRHSLATWAPILVVPLWFVYFLSLKRTRSRNKIC